MSVPEFPLRIWPGDPIEVSVCLLQHFFFSTGGFMDHLLFLALDQNKVLKTYASKTSAINFIFGRKTLITILDFRVILYSKFTESSKCLESQELLCALVILVHFLSSIFLFSLTEVIGLGNMKFSGDPSASSFLLVLKAQGILCFPQEDTVGQLHIFKGYWVHRF